MKVNKLTQLLESIKEIRNTLYRKEYDYTFMYNGKYEMVTIIVPLKFDAKFTFNVHNNTVLASFTQLKNILGIPGTRGDFIFWHIEIKKLNDNRMSSYDLNIENYVYPTEILRNPNKVFEWRVESKEYGYDSIFCDFLKEKLSYSKEIVNVPIHHKDEVEWK